MTREENKPLVSVIIPFYNTPADFMREAIESVIDQTYINWEILLINDGSMDASTQAALNFAEQYPSKIRYLEHEGHQNRGISASRQLGIDSANGNLIAFLDADDVWLPIKLEQQVSLMNENPHVGMLYGNTIYWYSWEKTGKGQRQDYIPNVSYKTSGEFQPPELLPLYFSGKAAVPCTCSVLVRRDVIQTCGGMEKSFTGMYEDQAFYSKIVLTAPVYISLQTWDKYRQHTTSVSAVAESIGQTRVARVVFLRWLEAYLWENGIEDTEVWLALKRELWFFRGYENNPNPMGRLKIITRLKKWLLKLEEKVLPTPLRRWIWLRSFAIQRLHFKNIE